MKKTKKTKKPLLPRINSDAPAAPTSEEIAACAYYIWEREGRPEGRGVEHWLAAEVELRQARCQNEPPQ